MYCIHERLHSVGTPLPVALCVLNLLREGRGIVKQLQSARLLAHSSARGLCAPLSSEVQQTGLLEAT